MNIVGWHTQTRSDQKDPLLLGEDKGYSHRCWQLLLAGEIYPLGSYDLQNKTKGKNFRLLAHVAGWWHLLLLV